MVSRRKILSRSRDDLTLDDDPPRGNLFSARFEEDVWYTKQKLFSDHVGEIIKKWESIDDEIWAKAIVMERNRRVAKAYARAPVLTVNGGEGGFDGFRLGLNGFSNPMRDPKTEEFKEAIGLGAKVKMDENGNILVKRLSKSPVYVHSGLDEGSLSNSLLKISNNVLDMDKPHRVFDMRKFQQNINRELRRSNPDRNRLESQCVISICFVKYEEELLDSPIWILIINIVALEMLKAKLPNSSRVPLYTVNGDKTFPVSGSSDEDPYSLTSGNGSSGSSKDKEKSGILLKKEKDYYVPQNWTSTQDRRRDRSRDNFLDEPESATLKPRTNNRRRILKKSDEKKKIVDDPYYCGFSARVPAFASAPVQPATPKLEKNKDKVAKYREPGVLIPGYPGAGQSSGVNKSVPASQSAPNLAQIPKVQPYWWQSRLYPEQTRAVQYPEPVRGAQYPPEPVRGTQYPQEQTRGAQYPPEQTRGAQYPEGTRYPDYSRRYPEPLPGKGLLGLSPGYMDARLPYNFNEFSSLQFTARVGLPGGRGGAPPGSPRPGGGGAPTTLPKQQTTPKAKTKKNFLRQHVFKSSS